MHPLSCVIITFNEERNIKRCIQSAWKVADEVIVVDSYSTDQTVEIARELGAKVYLEKFRGYIGQKNYANSLASHNYILSLDADELLNDDLVQSILETKKTFLHRVYAMKRCARFYGKYIRHGLWYPDKKVRLFDRTIVRWGGMNPHDKIQLNSHFAIRQLKGEIIHNSFDNIDELICKNNQVSTAAAASLFANKVKSSWFKILVHPLWAFINGYIFKRGFLDGVIGLSIAVNSAHQVFLKYTKLYQFQAEQKKEPTTTIIRQFPMHRKSVSGS